jgi:GDP-4-dehydro-6-deoxy-D-mannose reductase
MPTLAGARVLVTGVSGFVGRHLVRALVSRGAQVHGSDVAAPPPGGADSGLASLVSGFDVRDPEGVCVRITESRPDVIVHLAARSNAGESFRSPTETFDVNAIGTWNLLDATRAAAPGARVLLVGTGEVYGPQPMGTRVDEEAPLRPVSPYALSKAAAEAMGGIAHDRFGLDVVHTRSFGHLGPGQSSRFFLPAFASQIAEIECGRGEPVLRVGNLDVTRDLCDVRDVVVAYADLIERGRPGSVYNVCRGEGISLRAVAQDLVARARVPIRIEVDPQRMRPADVPYLVGDPTRIHAEIGWRSAMPLANTLDDVLAEWRTGVTRS